MTSVAVLFARSDSVYKTLDCDVFDIARNALTYAGGFPVVAHPPCRAWGRLAHRAKPRPGERALALWAVDVIRANGGVLEHPRASRLWKEKPLPKVGERDAGGGFTLAVDQFHWGHRAQKATNLYVCGCEPEDVPVLPKRQGAPTHVISTGAFRKGDANWRPCVTHVEREATPPLFAAWLLELARKCGPSYRDLV